MDIVHYLLIVPKVYYTMRHVTFVGLLPFLEDQTWAELQKMFPDVAHVVI